MYDLPLMADRIRLAQQPNRMTEESKDSGRAEGYLPTTAAAPTAAATAPVAAPASAGPAAAATTAVPTPSTTHKLTPLIHIYSMNVNRVR